MMVNFKRLFLFNVLVLAHSQVFAFSDPAAELESRLNSFVTMQANFSQTVKSARGKILQKTAGKMAVWRPGHFRWDITTPSPQLIVADGRNLWVYESGLKQATVKRQGRSMGGSPAAFLSGRISDLRRAFSISSRGSSFHLAPTRKGMDFQSIDVKFTGNALQNMKLVDSLGQQSELSFSSVRLNSPSNPSLFQFTPPRGTDVIGSAH